MHIHEPTRPFAPVGRFKYPSDLCAHDLERVIDMDELFHKVFSPLGRTQNSPASPQGLSAKKTLSWDPGTPEYK